MCIWYHDRQGIIQSSGINLIQDLPRFKPEDWGRNKDFLGVQAEEKQSHEFKIMDKVRGTVDLLLHTSHDEKVPHYGLQERATNMAPATSEALTMKYSDIQDGMVVNIFWGEASRTNEPKILGEVEEIAKMHPTIQGHIPELLWHHTFANSTSTIREALGVSEPTTGSRVLYILVFCKLHPITKLHGKEFFDVWHQCIMCHITLWKEGFLHQDVNPGNLMWCRKDGKLIGVLNDYDLSSLADDPGPRGSERTGTVPFMALDLLTAKAQRGEVKHLFRHDLESFMWVFAWIFLRYRQGVLLPRRSRPFDDWATLGAITCGEKKLFFLENPFDFQPPDLQTSESDIDWFLWELLVECFEALDTAAYNRRSRIRRNRLAQQRPKEGAREQLNNEETVSDTEALLGKFTGTMARVKLSDGSPSQ